MSGEKLVGDLQIPLSKCLLLPANIQVSDAITIIQQSGRQNVPCHPVMVMNQQWKPVGVLSVKDLTIRNDTFLEGNVISFAQAAQSLRGNGPLKRRRKVAQLMQPIRLTSVSALATLAEAIHKMVRHHLQFLPVSDDNVLTGVISIHQILQEAALIMTVDCKQGSSYWEDEGGNSAETVF